MDRDGIPGGRDDRWPIDALPDAPPEVSIEQPAADLYVAPRAVVAVRISASDDLAVREIDLVIEPELRGAAVPAAKAGETPAPQAIAGQVQSRRLFTGPRRPAPRAGEQLDAASPADHRTVEYRLELAPLGLLPGSHVTLLATAGDYHDQVGRSNVRRLTVLLPEELRERLAARQSRLAAELERLLASERICRRQVGAIQRRLSGKGKIGSAEIGDLEAAERGQREVNESLTSRADGTPAQLQAMLVELADSDVAEAGLSAPVAAVAEGIDRLGREVLPSLGGELLAAVKTARIDRQLPGSDARQRVSAALQQAAGLQDRAIEALKQWLAALSQSDEYGRLQRDLGRLRRDQDALTGRTREVGRRTLTLDPGDVPPGDAVELAAAADRQLELADRLDRLLDSLGSLSDEMRDEARRTAVGEQMRRTAEEIRQNQLGQASAGQKQIAADLRCVSELLSGRAEETADSHSPGSKQSADCAAHRREPSAPIARGRPGCPAGRQGRGGRHAGVAGRPAGAGGVEGRHSIVAQPVLGSIAAASARASPAMGRRGFSAEIPGPDRGLLSAAFRAGSGEGEAMMNAGIGELGHEAGGGSDGKMQNAKCNNSAECDRPLELRHSERSEESSLRRNSGKILRCAQNDGRCA